MDAFARVLAQPGSLAARKALLEEWSAANDPRAELLQTQLELRDRHQQGDFSSTLTHRLENRVTVLTRDHSREFAGEIADLVDDVTFHRGLVAEVELSGESFLAVAERLFELAPVQHVNLTKPLGDFGTLFGSPLLDRLVSLAMPKLGAAFGNRGAIALASSRRAARLRWIDLSRDDISEAGVEALAASPYLENTAFISLSFNPVDPTPSTISDEMGGRIPMHVPLAATLERQFGKRPWLQISDPEHWPPDRDELAVTA